MTNAVFDRHICTRGGDVIEADVGGAVVLLQTQNWQYFQFDKVGTAIWNLLNTPRSMNWLVDELAMRFEVDRDRCLREVKAFLDEIAAQGLITVSDE